MRIELEAGHLCRPIPIGLSKRSRSHSSVRWHLLTSPWFKNSNRLWCRPHCGTGHDGPNAWPPDERPQYKALAAQQPHLNFALFPFDVYRDFVQVSKAFPLLTSFLLSALLPTLFNPTFQHPVKGKLVLLEASHSLHGSYCFINDRRTQGSCLIQRRPIHPRRPTTRTRLLSTILRRRPNIIASTPQVWASFFTRQRDSWLDSARDFPPSSTTRDRQTDSSLVPLLADSTTQCVLVRPPHRTRPPRPPPHPYLPTFGPASQATNVNPAPQPAQRLVASTWICCENGCCTVYEGQAGLQGEQWRLQDEITDAPSVKNRFVRPSHPVVRGGRGTRRSSRTYTESAMSTATTAETTHCLPLPSVLLTRLPSFRLLHLPTATKEVR